MTATICGHDRALLRWSCAQSSPMIAVWSTDPELAESERGRAARATADPAKLAAILADLIRGRGIEPKRCRAGQHAHDGKIHIVVYFGDDAKGGLFDMSRARRLALALLDAPNATAQDVERMIEEVTQ